VSDRAPPGARAWLRVAALLAALALLGGALPEHALDWQPGRITTEPWRALTPVALHYSLLHLGANLLGCTLVAALGRVARLPTAAAWAWLAAWPLTHLGLLAQPALLHYGGLSGVLHAGVAVACVHLLQGGPGRPRVIGALLMLGLLSKIALERPWATVLSQPAGWDIAVAPAAHATGVLAGVLCALLAHALSHRRAPRQSVDA
jgi:rhomboid family GlyGly-CTERM serine protease